MQTIARATFPRAICNWQPSERHAVTFMPPLERHRIANERLTRTLGTFKLREDRIVGVGKQNLLVGLEVTEEEGKISLKLNPTPNLGLELTSKGPKLFDENGKERRETVCFDAAAVDITRIRRIVNCTLNNSGLWYPDLTSSR